jgi:hypothetical protein
VVDASKSRAAIVPSADALTAAAVGVITAPLMFLSHELLGHGVATLVFGAHIVRVTSVNESWNGDVSDAATRTIAAAGIAANLLFGSLALLIFRRVAKSNAKTRFFLWFFGHAELFMGSGYLMAGAIFRFGDPPQVLNGLPVEGVWRIAAAIIGFLIFFFARIDAEKTLVEWAGSERRIGHARTLSLVPYLAMGTAATLSGLVGPDPHHADVGWSALATFAASLPFALLPFALPKAAAYAEPLVLSRSRGWIAAGATAVAFLFFILAPGVPR